MHYLFTFLSFAVPFIFLEVLIFPVLAFHILCYTAKFHNFLFCVMHFLINRSLCKTLWLAFWLDLSSSSQCVHITSFSIVCCCFFVCFNQGFLTLEEVKLCVVSKFSWQDLSDAQWRNFRGNLPILTIVFLIYALVANVLRSQFLLRAKGMSIIWLIISFTYLLYLHQAWYFLKTMLIILFVYQTIFFFFFSF